MITHSSMPSRRETTGKYWNFKPFLGLKKLQQFLLPQRIPFGFLALFVLGNATNRPSGAAAMTLFESPLTCGLPLPGAGSSARAKPRPRPAFGGILPSGSPPQPETLRFNRAPVLPLEPCPGLFPSSFASSQLCEKHLPRPFSVARMPDVLCILFFTCDSSLLVTQRSKNKPSATSLPLRRSHPRLRAFGWSVCADCAII
jgi:hypothetical protein